VTTLLPRLARTIPAAMRAAVRVAPARFEIHAQARPVADQPAFGSFTPGHAAIDAGREDAVGQLLRLTGRRERDPIEAVLVP
jgi:hypothetical protein